MKVVIFNKHMETEIQELKRQLFQSYDNFKRSKKVNSELIRHLRTKLQDKELQCHYERNLRRGQLTLLLRTLIDIETNLKKKQQDISSELLEKDFLIQKQNTLIEILRKRNHCCKQYKNIIESETSNLTENSQQSITRGSHICKCIVPTSKFESRRDIDEFFNIKVNHNQYQCAPLKGRYFDKIIYDKMESEGTLRSHVIPFFDFEDPNDVWYVSNDQDVALERKEIKNMYINNPVLECVNQILVQNIDYSYPAVRTSILTEDSNLYETPIYKPTNIYESLELPYTTVDDLPRVRSDKNNRNRDTFNTEFIQLYHTIKPKSLHSTPIISNYEMSDSSENNSEPTYCSISELNLPNNIVTKSEFPSELNLPNFPKKSEKIYIHDNFETTKNALIKSIQRKEDRTHSLKLKQTEFQQEIPRLPQVTEIIIHEEKMKNEKINLGSTVRLKQDGISQIPIMSKNNNFEILKENRAEKDFNEKYMFQQNFEEFKIDEYTWENCDMNISNICDLYFKNDTPKNNKSILNNCSSVFKTLEFKCVNILKQQINNKIPSTYSILNEENRESLVPPYEYFLECSGLSSKPV